MENLFQFILNTIPIENFMNLYYQKKALYIPGDNQRFCHLFNWQDFNNTINSSHHVHSGIKMSQNGRQFRPKDSMDLIKYIQNGATCIFENIDRYHIPLGNFLNKFSEEINEETRFNLYLSYPEQQGYNIHYDTQDFLILQLYGYKEWWIFPETIPSVLFYQKTHGFDPPPKELCYLNCTLTSGDVLYVPRGHWHYAIAKDEPSLHLTLAMFVKTGIDFMKWITDELTDCEEFRKDASVKSLTCDFYRNFILPSTV